MSPLSLCDLCFHVFHTHTHTHAHTSTHPPTYIYPHTHTHIHIHTIQQNFRYSLSLSLSPSFLLVPLLSTSPCLFSPARRGKRAARKLGRSGKPQGTAARSGRSLAYRETRKFSRSDSPVHPSACASSPAAGTTATAACAVPDTRLTLRLRRRAGRAAAVADEREPAH